MNWGEELFLLENYSDRKKFHKFKAFAKAYLGKIWFESNDFYAYSVWVIIPLASIRSHLNKPSYLLNPWENRWNCSSWSFWTPLWMRYSRPSAVVAQESARSARRGTARRIVTVLAPRALRPNKGYKVPPNMVGRHVSEHTQIWQAHTRCHHTRVTHDPA